MKRLLNILVLIGVMTASLLVALVVTWLAWEMCIPGRAFHCTDGGISLGFWTSANLHETAGDKILPGWTWEKLSLVNNVYKGAFFALWIGGGAGVFRISRTVLPDYV